MASSILSALTKEYVKQYVQQQLQNIIELQQNATNIQSPPQQNSDLHTAVSSKYCFELDGKKKVEEENISPSFEIIEENSYLETKENEHFENFTHILLNTIKKKYCEKIDLPEIKYSLSCSENSTTTTTPRETKYRVSCTSLFSQSSSSCSSFSSQSSGASASCLYCCYAGGEIKSCLREAKCGLNCCFVHNSEENNHCVPQPPIPPVPVSQVVPVTTVTKLCVMQNSMCSSLHSLSLSLLLPLQHLLHHQTQLCFDQQRLFSSFSDSHKKSSIISVDLKSDRSGKGDKGGKGSIIIIGGERIRTCGQSVESWRRNQWSFASSSRKFNRRRETSTFLGVRALAAKAALSAASQAA